MKQIKKQTKPQVSDDFIEKLAQACLWGKTESQGGLNNKQIKDFIIKQGLATPEQIRQVSRDELCKHVVSYVPIKFPKEPEKALEVLVEKLPEIRQELTTEEIRKVAQVSSKVRKQVAKRIPPPEEIYTFEDPLPQGWITGKGGIRKVANPRTFQVLQFIKERYFGDDEIRIFTKDKALWLLRWLGPNCWDFMEQVMAGATPEDIDDLCAARFRFLENFWDAANLILFMNNEDAQQEIMNALAQSVYNNIYILRLSTTQPGTLAVQYYHPKLNRVMAQRLVIDEDGGITVPWTNEIVYDINEFDEKFSKAYFDRYGIQLASPKKAVSVYAGIANAYRDIN